MTLSRAVLITLAAIASTTPSRPAARAAAPQTAARFDQKLFGEMRWRNIGPHRAGRTKAAAGVPQQPYTFYVGVVNGGVWKTTDAGRTWKPIFDDQPTGSIGSIAVAPSDPNVVYVGSGEGLARPDLSVGDGVFKSTDAGKTWTLMGLRDGQQIPNIAIDPGNPNRLFVAVAGHPYGPSSDVQPTTLHLKTIADAQARAGKVTARWTAAKADLLLLNARLKQAGLPELDLRNP